MQHIWVNPLFIHHCWHCSCFVFFVIGPQLQDMIATAAVSSIYSGVATELVSRVLTVSTGTLFVSKRSKADVCEQVCNRYAEELSHLVSDFLMGCTCWKSCGVHCGCQ